jgi:hypothetical protein
MKEESLKEHTGQFFREAILILKPNKLLHTSRRSSQRLATEATAE